MPSKKLIALIVVITVVPMATLLWLGWLLLSQDRLLEAHQRQQQIERAVDLVVAALQRSISISQQRLAAAAEDWPEGAVAVTFRTDGVAVQPKDRIAFLPTIPALPEPPAAAFVEGERLEFQQQDRPGAIRIYAELSKSSNPAIRAGALLRLGRNLANPNEALAAYSRLSMLDNTAIDGVSAGLVGHYARCQLLEREKRTSELHAEAAQLARQIDAGRWTLRAPVYWLYAGDVARWTGAGSQGPRPSELLAESVGALWEKRPLMPSSLTLNGRTFVVIWQVASGSTRALIATPEFVQTQWMPAATAVANQRRISFAFDDHPGTRRKAADTGLPWNISAASLDPPGHDRNFILRRRMLIAGFLLLVSMALAAAYLIFRAVSRELAVARLQSDFVAAVSHEFRTPLTTLLQFTTMLRENAAITEERRRLCYDAQARAAHRLQALVESLLDFGRMEAGARRYHFEQRDCAQVVRRTVEEFRTDSQASGFRIEFDSDGSTEVETDAEALARAVRNLLENAVKYSAERREVEVGLQRHNGDVRIAVRDHGIGIPAHERANIFKKFQRGEQARTRGIKGTGIGLAMVEEIVKAHHGCVEVESEPGKGSTFTIVLPVKG
jgi:signal transduction histidine kinase